MNKRQTIPDFVIAIKRFSLPAIIVLLLNLGIFTALVLATEILMDAFTRISHYIPLVPNKFMATTQFSFPNFALLGVSVPANFDLLGILVPIILGLSLGLWLVKKRRSPANETSLH